MYLVELLEKSLKGTLKKDEADKLISMLEGEIKFIKDSFDDKKYIVTIKNNGEYETGIVSETLDVICIRYLGHFQNIRTSETYNDSDIISYKITI